MPTTNSSKNRKRARSPSPTVAEEDQRSAKGDHKSSSASNSLLVGQPIPSKTTTFVGFFRALNVSGHNVIKMTDLANVVQRDGGASSCRTYIQSGNMVFTLPAADPSLNGGSGTKKNNEGKDGSAAPSLSDGMTAFRQRVLDALSAKHGITNSELMIRGLQELDDMILAMTVPIQSIPSSPPITSPDALFKHLQCFLFDSPCVPTDKDEVRKLLVDAGKVKDEMVVCIPPPRRQSSTTQPGRLSSELLVYFPSGVVKSKVTIEVLKKVFQTARAPTARNWATILAMRKLCV